MFLERVSREILPQLTLFTPILFQLLSEHVFKQIFKPKYALKCVIFVEIS